MQVGPLIVAYKIIPTMQVVICIVANWSWHLWFLNKRWILMLLGMHKGFKFFQLSIELSICFVFLCMWFGLLFVVLAICFTMFFCVLHPCNYTCCVHLITINCACGVINLLMSSFYGILLLNDCVSISYFHQTLVWKHPFLVDVKLCYILSIIDYMCIQY
jgi:hypothetical protein